MSKGCVTLCVCPCFLRTMQHTHQSLHTKDHHRALQFLLVCSLNRVFFLLLGGDRSLSSPMGIDGLWELVKPLITDYTAKDFVEAATLRVRAAAAAAGVDPEAASAAAEVPVAAAVRVGVGDDDPAPGSTSGAAVGAAAEAAAAEAEVTPISPAPAARADSAAAGAAVAAADEVGAVGPSSSPPTAAPGAPGPANARGATTHFLLLVDVSMFAAQGLHSPGASAASNAWVMYVLAHAMSDRGTTALKEWLEQ